MDGDATLFAYLALGAWLPVSMLVFRSFRAATATAALLIGAMLLLPVRFGFDVSGLPAFDKELTANLCVLLGVFLFAHNRLKGQRIGRGMDLLVVALVVGAALTPLANGDLLVYGPTVLPGMRAWDSVSESVQQLLNVGVPFVLGRILFKRSRDLRQVLVLLAVAGLIYSIPILWEIRMSPQLHQMIYGYHQHAFRQTIRDGGYRPMVFMSHGLALTVFILVAAMAATALAKSRRWISRIPAVAVPLYLTALLLMCRGFTATVYGLAVLPIMLLARPSIQLRVASLLAVAVLVYPLARALDAFPADGIVSLASRIDEDRGRSLKYRFDNEDELVAKAGRRPLLGWGTYNRNRVFNERTGIPSTITDGYWIVQLGSRGVVGLVSVFALLLLPVWRASWQLDRIRSRRDRNLIAGLSLIVVVYTVDLLPNGFFSSFTVFLAGVLAGLVPGLQAEQRGPGQRRLVQQGPSGPNAGVRLRAQG